MSFPYWMLALRSAVSLDLAAILAVGLASAQTSNLSNPAGFAGHTRLRMNRVWCR